MRRAAPGLALLALLAGCASGPEAAPGEGPGPFAWDTRPDPAEVTALRERVTPFASPDGAACLATLVRRQPDTAHALLAASEPGPLPAAVFAALPTEEAAAWSGDPVPYRQAEATLQAAAEALQRGDSPELPAEGWPTRSQAARAAYLALGADWKAGEQDPQRIDRALRLAPADWTATQRLEEMRALGGFTLPPARQREWHRHVAGLALDRGRALVAIQHASAARALAQSPGEVSADRALLAEAYLGARQAEPALNEAEGAAALARTPAERTRCQALRGQALLLAGDPRAAADAFAAAQRAAMDARDEAGVLRQALNRALAWLRAGEPALAKEASAELQALAVVPVGPEAPDLLARRAIVAAQAGLLAGELDPIQAAERVEAALLRAREAGVVAVLDAYAGLPERLRKGRP